MNKRAPAMVSGALALILAGPLAAQEVDSTTRSLEGIDRSLKQIVKLLKIQVSNQQAELAVQRLDIARRELVALERELHQSESARDEYAEQQAELQNRVETFGSQTPDGSTGMSEEQVEYFLNQLELEIESVKQALWRTDQRILDLQGEIRRVREDLEVWETVVTDSFTND